MVNLIVSHGSHLQGTALHEEKTAATAQHNQSPSMRRNPSIPLQIHSLVSRPMTTTNHQLSPTDSIFDVSNRGSTYLSSVNSSGRVRDKYSGYRVEMNESTMPLTCDYDTNATQLYEMLESSQWEDAIERCHSHPEEVRTWINRRGRWQVLPLHASIIFQAPRNVIEAILKAHPVACSEIDDQGMLPLHLAFRHRLEEYLLELVMGEYPEGIHYKDKRGRTPIEHAKVGGFSPTFTRMYAETSSSCDRNEKTVLERSCSIEESQVASLQMVYENRIEELARKHEQAIHRLRVTAENEKEELREFLSKEVASSQRSSLLESELYRLQSSLASSNRETRELRRLLKQQEEDQRKLKDKIRLVVNNQHALHGLCVQHQERLKQSQRMREDMLRALLEKEAGETAFGISTEICRVSGNVMTSTEQLFSQLFSTHEREGNQANPIEVLQEEEMRESTMENHQFSWPDQPHHHDEISAITELSQF